MSWKYCFLFIMDGHQASRTSKSFRLLLTLMSLSSTSPDCRPTASLHSTGQLKHENCVDAIPRIRVTYSNIFSFDFYDSNQEYNSSNEELRVQIKREVFSKTYPFCIVFC